MHLINFTLLLFAGLAAAHPAPTRTTDPKATIAGCWNPVAPVNSSCVASDVPYCATHSPAGYYHHGLEECDWRTGSKGPGQESCQSQCYDFFQDTKCYNSVCNDSGGVNGTGTGPGVCFCDCGVTTDCYGQDDTSKRSVGIAGPAVLEG
ncbi:hypothetical protein SLS57_012393 [Botryosphaeria dothidea]